MSKKKPFGPKKYGSKEKSAKKKIQNPVWVQKYWDKIKRLCLKTFESNIVSKKCLVQNLPYKFGQNHMSKIWDIDIW